MDQKRKTFQNLFGLNSTSSNSNVAPSSSTGPAVYQNNQVKQGPIQPPASNSHNLFGSSNVSYPQQVNSFSNNTVQQQTLYQTSESNTITNPVPSFSNFFGVPQQQQLSNSIPPAQMNQRLSNKMTPPPLFGNTSPVPRHPYPSSSYSIFGQSQGSAAQQ